MARILQARNGKTVDLDKPVLVRLRDNFSGAELHYIFGTPFRISDGQEWRKLTIVQLPQEFMTDCRIIDCHLDGYLVIGRRNGFGKEKVETGSLAVFDVEPF